MSLDALRESVAIVRGKVPTEASGGVTLDAIGAIGATGVTYVSVGRGTQSAPAADIVLDFALACPGDTWAGVRAHGARRPAASARGTSPGAGPAGGETPHP